MLQIDTFWRELLPLFTDYEFIYVFLDLATIISFIKVMLFLPSILLLSSKGDWRKW